jgi:hypothetical protein
VDRRAKKEEDLLKCMKQLGNLERLLRELIEISGQK